MTDYSNQPDQEVVDTFDSGLTFRILGGDLSLAQTIVEEKESSQSGSKNIQFLNVNYGRESFKTRHFGPEQVLTFTIEVGKDVSTGVLAAWVYDKMKNTDIDKIYIELGESNKFEGISIKKSELKAAIDRWFNNKD